MEQSNKDKGKKVSFKDTLNLPRTEFPIRPNAKENDPKMLKRWESENLYKKTFEKNEGNKKFILHDGPPYANGHTHLGHAYNKIQKDIVCKAQRMQEKHVPVTPGWDCHGLPIELNVTKEFPGLSKTDLKGKCREYANKWINIQRDEFKKMGVLMDWEHPYLTMNYEYEASIMQAFGKFVQGGYIERKNKTVPWCYHCQTVLATAEIEHQERKDPSIYVEFSLDRGDIKNIFPELADKNISLLIWTTTPWTLPLNRAVVLKPEANYVVLKVKGKYVILGKSLVEKLCKLMEIDCNIVDTFVSEKLKGINVLHPFVEGLSVPVIFDSFVAMDEGTACVHSAPGCGPEDYEIGLKNNLEIFSPLSADGKYTEGIVPHELEGVSIEDAQGWVIKKLLELDKLLHKTSIRHSYPHCWRCRHGLMFRATKQWFCDLSKHGLKEKALKACDKIESTPEKSINRLKAAIESRLEWCISRQRVWGVPIVALLCNKCDTPFFNKELVDKVADGVAQKGIEFWDEVSIDQLISTQVTCENCGEHDFSKEKDILDVWFDSGISHFAVLQKNKSLEYPADLYLEGKDQHRGWFQSSLLTSLVIEGEPCMRKILTHGFTVDKKGRKMSKSLGNVVATDEIIGKLGTDGLRFWVASIDCKGEAVVSDTLMKNVQEVYRRIRNTLRFLLSNLYDFDIEKDAVDIHKLLPIDRYALGQLTKFNQEILLSYEAYDFTAVFHKLADYCAVDLSSFYLDIIKDRLYVEKSDGLLRRSAQTTCWYILDTLTRLVAPILSITAEQVSDFYQKDKKESIHLQTFSDLSNVWKLFCEKYKERNESIILPHLISFSKTHEVVDLLKYIDQKEKTWAILKDVRSAILKAIEEQRAKQIMRHSLEARVTVFFDLNDERLSVLNDFSSLLEKAGQDLDSFFKEFLIVSQFQMAINSDKLATSGLNGLFVRVDRASGEKCPRCWQWDITEHEHQLCRRCQAVLEA